MIQNPVLYMYITNSNWDGIINFEYTMKVP